MSRNSARRFSRPVWHPLTPLEDRWARFGVFEADLLEATLTKSGHPVVIQDQPFRLLVRLLREPEALVSREQVREAVWPDGMTVDFERGLNTALNKLRAALGDSAEAPRFIETVPRKGYRFLATVKWSSERESAVAVDQAPTVNPATRRGWHLAALAGVVLVLLAVASVVMRTNSPSQGADSAAAPKLMLAVLPFTDLSSVPGYDYFSRGLTEEMISRLGGMAPSKLGVIARSTSEAYRDRDRPVSAIGAELGVEYVLEGSVRRSGKRVRITAQLISVEDETHLWTESYDSTLEDIVGTQNRVATRIGETLAVDVLGLPGATSAIDPDAYEAYLKGLHFRDMLTEEGYRKAIVEFERAHALDPDFAPALASMSACYCLLAGHGLEIEKPAILMTRTQELATQALALDNNLAEAHGTLGMAHLKYRWDWAAAERELRLATEINPSDPMAAIWYSFYLSSQGLHSDAIDQAEKARRTDPVARIPLVNLAWQYYEARRYEEAVSVFDESLALFPHFWVGYWGGGVARLRLGDSDGAMAYLERAVDLSQRSASALGSLSHAYAMLGEEARAREILVTLLARSETEYVPPAIFVPIYAELGDLDRAFGWLQKAFDMRSRSMVWINVSHDFDALREDSRYDEIVHRMGLPVSGVRDEIVH